MPRSLLRALCATSRALCVTFPLPTGDRSADCIHLVTALRQGFDTIHTHDRHQATAAEHLGLRAVTLS